MLLETRLDDDIRKAISQYKEICKDPTNLSGVDPNYMGETRRLEFVTEFIRAGGAKSREKKARQETKVYGDIKRVFAHYIGMKIFGQLDLKRVNIPEEVMIIVGNLIIDTNYNDI